MVIYVHDMNKPDELFHKLKHFIYFFEYQTQAADHLTSVKEGLTRKFCTDSL